jgi:hypothetical protein
VKINVQQNYIVIFVVLDESEKQPVPLRVFEKRALKQRLYFRRRKYWEPQNYIMKRFIMYPYNSINIFRVIKLRTRLAYHLACMGGMINANRIL